MKLTLPWPSKELSPNARLHYHALAKAKAAFRAECGWIAKVNKPMLPEGRIRLEIMFHPPSRHHWDLDGLLSRMKSGLDGVCEVWGIDDVRFRPIQIDIGEPVKGGSVILTINDID